MASLFKNLSIRKKLILVLGASLFFAGGVILSGVLHMLWMKRSAALIYDEAFKEAENVYVVKAKMDQVRRGLLMAMLEKDPARRQENFDIINSGTAVIDEKLSVIRASSAGEQARKAAARALDVWREFKSTRDNELIPLIKRGEGHAALSLALGVQEERFREFTAITDRLIAQSNERAALAQDLVARKFRAASITFAALSIAGLLLAISLILYFSKEVRARTRQIMKGIEGFQAGEGPVSIEALRNDELGKIEAALGRLFRQAHENRIAQEQYRNILSWEAQEKERKRAELERSQEKFRALVEAMSDWVWEADRDSVFTYSSPRVQALLGYSPDEVAGRTLFDLMPAEERSASEAALNEILKLREPFSNIETRLLHKGGHVVVLETSAAPFNDASGAFRGYRGISRDITERLRAEEEKAAIRERLVKADKMASIGRLAAGVAHEINTPAGYVNSNLKLLSAYFSDMTKLLRAYAELEKAAEAEGSEAVRRTARKTKALRADPVADLAINEGQEVLNETRDGLDRIIAIVKGLRDFSHPDAGEMAACDINRCVDDAIRLVWHEVKHVCELRKGLGELSPVECRPHQITQVIVNILMNAAQSMERGGSIWIRTWQDRDRVCVTIRDNGSGMDREVKARAFEPFFTTKPAGKGTGLGLSIAYGIITGHNGTIRLESEEGKGTAFLITLPARQELHSAA